MNPNPINRGKWKIMPTTSLIALRIYRPSYGTSEFFLLGISK
jgi:hypothetical protein